MEKNKKILFITSGVIISIALIIGIIIFILNQMPNKNIGTWNLSSQNYSGTLKLYDNKKFELTANVIYTIGKTYQTNVTYKGTYKYFNGSITLIPNNEDMQFKGNFGENRLTLRKVESDGTSGDFLEFKR